MKSSVPSGRRTGPPGPVAPGLHFVATPIGAARDITLRALDILGGADLIAAEDTRTARKLMEIHGIALNGRKVVAYHDHSGQGARDRIVGDIAEGRSVAYVSEAGTPLVADPGYALGRAVIARGLAVFAAPGASAVLAALAVSGLPTDRFAFVGFMPPARAARRAALAELRDLGMTLVFYESPKRVSDLLGDLAQDWGGSREAVVCRELTKKFEEVSRGTLEALAAAFADRDPKGEIVVLVAPAGRPEAGDDEIAEALRVAMRGARVKDAANMVAGAMGLPRRQVYQIALDLARDDDG